MYVMIFLRDEEDGKETATQYHQCRFQGNNKGESLQTYFES